ncbi:MAG: drug/metabolite transporter (DMT)-like permease [Ilumatobacter sp.]|jgi:drug/metabolite transporter (DMT)-like permease
MSDAPELRPVVPGDAVQRRAGLLLALLAAVVSGVAIYVNGQAVSRFPSPTVYTTGKNVIAGILLVGLALVAVSGSSAPAAGRAQLTQRDMVWLAVVAFIGGAVPFVLFFEGLSRATSSDAAFIHKTLVVWVAVLAVVILRERLTWVHVGSVVLLVVAQVAIADGVGSLRPGVGEAMILGATLCWSVELIIVKRLVATVHPTIVGASRIAGGAVLLLLWLLVTGRLRALTSLSASQWAWLMLTGLILSVFVSVWFAALARAQAIDVAAILVLGAVITGVLNVADGGAVMPVQAAGWILIGVAVGVLVVWQARPEPQQVLA